MWPSLGVCDNTVLFTQTNNLQFSALHSTETTELIFIKIVSYMSHSLVTLCIKFERNHPSGSRDVCSDVRYA